MSTMQVGSNVTLTAECADLFELPRETIYRVCDCCLQNGRYMWVIAPELGTCVDANRARWVDREDVVVVGE